MGYSQKFKIVVVMALCLNSVLWSQIVAVEDMVHYVNAGNGLPAGTTYVKDVNNLLSDYVGTWSTTFENRVFSFKIDKHTQEIYIKEDILVLRTEIKNISGEVLYSTFDLSLNHSDVTKGNYLLDGAKSYRLTFRGDNYKCGEEGRIYLVKTASPNQLKFFFTQINDTVDVEECLGDVSFLFPIGTELILTKN